MIAALYALAMAVLLAYGLNLLWMALVYARHERLRPGPVPDPDALPVPEADWPVVTIQLPLYNEAAVRRAPLPAPPPRNPGARRLDRRDDGACGAACAPLAGARARHRPRPPHAPHRLQGRRPPERPPHGTRRSDRHLRRRLHPDPRLSAAPLAGFRRPRRRDGAGALGPPQRRRLAPDAHPGLRPRRPLRRGAVRAPPGRLLHQLQRDGRHLAPRVHRRGRGLAGRYARRRPRPQLPRPARRLALRLRRRRRGAGRAAGDGQRPAHAAIPLDEGRRRDRPQAPRRAA